MKVLQVTAVVGGAGGIETVVSHLTASLRKHGHDTLVVAGAAGGPVPVDAVVVPRLADTRGVVQVASDYVPDIVLFHHVDNPAVLRAIRPAHPSVMLLHTILCPGSKLFRRHDRLCHHRMGLRCYWDWYAGPCGAAASPVIAASSLQQSFSFLHELRQFSRVLVGSRYMYDHALAEGVEGDRLQLVDLVVDSAVPAHPARHVRPYPAEDPVRVLYVGRLVYSKGVQYLLRAMALLGPRYTLTVVGEGWYASSLISLASGLGIADRVSFVGVHARDQLASDFASADVVVVPSILPEPFGLIVSEALFYGLPVVVSDIGGLPEWSDRSEIVFPADPASAASLADAIIRATSQGSPPEEDVLRPSPHASLIDVLERSAGLNR